MMNSQPMLPPEVLVEIFSILEEPSDLSSVSRTCKDWRDALKVKKSLVFTHQVFPLVAKFLPPKTLLECRLVSKPLQRTIDKLIEHSLFRLNEKYCEYHWRYAIKVHPGMIKLVEKSYMFWHDNSVFMDKMRNHNRNPFIGNSLQFQFCFVDGPLLGHDKAISLVSRFGCHLKTFTHDLYKCLDVHSTRSPGVLIQAYKNLPEILSHLSNLQTLNIKWKCQSLRERRSSRPGLISISVDDYLPKELMASVKFPPMRCLTTINYSYPDGFLVSIGISLLTAYGRQLTTFSCYGTFLSSGRVTVQMINQLLPNLKKLRIWCDYSPEEVKKLVQVQIPLEEIQLCTNFYIGHVHPTNFVALINNFARSLVRLQYDLKNRSNFDLNGVFIKVCPKLTHFSTRLENVDLDAETHWFTRVVEKKFKNLELLDLHQDGNEYDRKSRFDPRTGNVPRADALIQRLFKSLPKLRKIRIFIKNEKYLSDIIVVLYR